jgi:hypothetical protein
VKRTQPYGLGCIQVGYHIDFTPIELWERYGSQQNYIDEVAGITCKAKRDGFQFLPTRTALSKKRKR